MDDSESASVSTGAVSSGDAPQVRSLSARYENLLIFILAAIQFVHLLDFVIMMPLSPQFMEYFHIGPARFGLLVSAYTLSAGISSLLGALYIDRFDRKAVTLFFFSGFTVATLFCALSPTYEIFLTARVVSGAFGGLMASMVMSIIGDVFPPERRGTATGYVMMAFSIVTVIGVPLGLWLNDLSSWHLPFFFIAGLGLLLIPVIVLVLPRMRGHLDEGVVSPFATIKAIFTLPQHWTVFAFTITTVMPAFMIIPYLAAYMVSNVGIGDEYLKHIYGVGGFCTLFTARMIGRASDKYGKRRVFSLVALISMIPILAMTHMPPVSFTILLVFSSLFFVFVSGRMVPGMAMIAGSIVPRFRGSFMSVNSSLRQLSMGLASFLAGLILHKTQGGRLLHFEWVGYAAIVFTVLCIGFAQKLKAVS